MEAKQIIIDATHGTAGIALMEVVNQIPADQYMEIGKLILQIIVAVGTILSMFSRKSKKE